MLRIGLLVLIIALLALLGLLMLARYKKRLDTEYDIQKQYTRLFWAATTIVALGMGLALGYALSLPPTGDKIYVPTKSHDGVIAPAHLE